jgi:K+-transporting ATPase ATPase A chain
MENPNYLTNMVETIFIFLIPIAMVFAMGHVLPVRSHRPGRVRQN